MMHFENWWASKYPAAIDETGFALVREAWDAAIAAEREAWRPAAWVVRETGGMNPMQCFELSLADAKATQTRWFADGYEAEIGELHERSNVADKRRP